MNRIELALSFALGWMAMTPCASAATFVWDDSTADHNWSTTNNWNLDANLPGSPDSVYFNNTAVGTNRVDRDFTVRYLYITNSVGTNFMEIAVGTDLSVTQAFWGPGQSRLVISGGTFRIGTNAAFAWIGNPSSTYQMSTSATLTVIDSTLEFYDRPDLYLPRGYKMARGGLVDLERATLCSDGETNALILRNLYFDQAVKDLVVESTTTLRLPPALRKIVVTNNMHIGSTGIGNRYLVPWSTLDFGTNPQLQVLSVSNNLTIGKVWICYSDGSTLYTNRFPPNIDITIGQPDRPASLQLGGTLGSEADITLTAFKRLETYLHTLTFGPHTGASGPENIELDCTATNTLELIGSITASNVSLNTLNVGTGSLAYAKLKLPASVTNISVGTLGLGGTYPCSISLGSNSLFRSLNVSKELTLGLGDFTYVDGAGVVQTGLPPDTIVRVGASTNERATLNVGWFDQNVSNSFGRGIGRFEAFLTSFRVGDTAGAASRFPVSTLDLRLATLSAFDIDGDARIGSADRAKGYVYLANGAVSASNVVLGYANSYSAALLWLSNTIVAVRDTATVLTNATVKTYLTGSSAGLDVGSTNLSVYAGSKIELAFLQDPKNPAEACWGLRLKGNAENLLQSLTNAPARLTWTTNALSEKSCSRFGIHYDAARNYTFIGIPRTDNGTLILVR